MPAATPRIVAALLTAVATAMPVLDDGGYSAGPRERFAVAALLAAAAAVWSDPARARRFARLPVVAILLVLGVLGAVSAAWTVGIGDEALRWGMVTAAYGLLVFAAAVLMRERRDVVLAAALIAAVAVAMGVIGLIAAATTDEPLAHRQAKGVWRPGATFQYSPALALLMISALAPIVSGLCHARRWWQSLALALAAAIIGATLVLADSRTQLLFALAVAALALARPQGVAGAPRGQVAAALALIFGAGLGAYAVAGGIVPLLPPPDDSQRLLALAAVVAGGALAWTALRGRVPAVALAVVLLAAGAGGALAKPDAHITKAGQAAELAAQRKQTPVFYTHTIRDKLLHGRLRIWGEAAQTFADRPLYGGGADSYWFASAEHQGPRSVFYAHQLPLELGAELGIAGLLLALALYATATRAIWRGRRGPAAWLLGPAAAAFLAANLVDWPWHLAGSGAVWALALGAVIGTTGATQERH